MSGKGVYLDYSINSRVYKVVNLLTKTIMESINVVVDDFTGDSSKDKVYTSLMKLKVRYR